MRILFLTMYYKPDNAATGILMAELAEELALHGHDVRVITSMPHYSTNSIWPEYQGKWSSRERQGDIFIHRVWSYVPVHKDRLLPRFFSYLSFTLLSALSGLLMPRPDVIVTPSPSPPLTNGISAYLLGRLRGIPFITNIQDIYPDVAIRMGVMKNKGVISGYKKLERFVYAHSHAITVISEGFRGNLTGKGVPADKISVIRTSSTRLLCRLIRASMTSAGSRAGTISLLFCSPAMSVCHRGWIPCWTLPGCCRGRRTCCLRLSAMGRPSRR